MHLCPRFKDMRHLHIHVHRHTILNINKSAKITIQKGILSINRSWIKGGGIIWNFYYIWDN